MRSLFIRGVIFITAHLQLSVTEIIVSEPRTNLEFTKSSLHPHLLFILCTLFIGSLLKPKFCDIQGYIETAVPKGLGFASRTSRTTSRLSADRQRYNLF